MEASALHAPVLGRRTLSTPLLRLRSDEQLVALFRAGNEDAFAAMHDRYRQRLFAYVRQMLSAASRADAEDVLQDVFVRAYGALRTDEREVNLRAWLYRVAHNRCIDHLRRPTPAAGEVFEMSRTPPLQDPLEAAQRRDDLRRLVDDVGRLPDQQRSALLMREIDGLAYVDIADALDVTLPAVKSLLVRARVGLVEAAEARDTDCAAIREDLLSAYDRGVKASGRARRHMRECEGCRDYRVALRGVRRSFAALSPVAGLGPLAIAAKVLGIGGASGGAAAGGGALAGGGAIATGGAVGATACKVAAVVCTAVVATGGAVEVKQLASERPAKAAKAAAAGAPAPRAAVPAQGAPVTTVAAAVGAPVSDATIRHRTGGAATTVGDVRAPERPGRARERDGGVGVAAPVEDPAAPAGAGTGSTGAGTGDDATGGVTAPADGGTGPVKDADAGSGAGPSTGAGADPVTVSPGGAGGSGTSGGGSTTPPSGGTGTGTGTSGGPVAETPAPDASATGSTPPPATSGPPPEH